MAFRSAFRSGHWASMPRKPAPKWLDTRLCQYLKTLNSSSKGEQAVTTQTPGKRETGKVQAMSTKEVLERHLKCFGDGDLAGLLADYVPDTVVFRPSGLAAQGLSQKGPPRSGRSFPSFSRSSPGPVRGSSYDNRRSKATMAISSGKRKPHRMSTNSGPTPSSSKTARSLHSRSLLRSCANDRRATQLRSL